MTTASDGAAGFDLGARSFSLFRYSCSGKLTPTRLPQLRSNSTKSAPARMVAVDATAPASIGIGRGRRRLVHPTPIEEFPEFDCVEEGRVVLSCRDTTRTCPVLDVPGIGLAE